MFGQYSQTTTQVHFYNSAIIKSNPIKFYVHCPKSTNTLCNDFFKHQFLTNTSAVPVQWLQTKPMKMSYLATYLKLVKPALFSFLISCQVQLINKKTYFCYTMSVTEQLMNEPLRWSLWKQSLLMMLSYTFTVTQNNIRYLILLVYSLWSTKTTEFRVS